MNLRRPTFGRSPDQRRRRSRGQGLVEFALVLPVLILAMLIVIDFGRLFFSYVTLNNVVRIAANYGSTDPSAFTGTPNTTNYNAVVARESAGLNCTLQPDAAGHNPPIPVVPANPTLGSMSVATMRCDFHLITPIIGAVFGGNGTLPITASSQFPIRTGAINNISGSTTLPPPGSPVAAFTFTGVSGGTINGSGNVTGTTPVTVNVVDGSSNAQTWHWEWGDGSEEFVQTPQPHQYSSANTYVVRLTVTNTVGSSSTTRTVTVTDPAAPPPVAGFYGTPVGSPPNANGGGTSGAAITGSQPLVVDFTNTSSNGTGFSWDFGDGSAPSTSASPQHQFSSLGIFTVTLSITAPAGGTSFTRNAYVTVGCVVPNFANTSTASAGAAWTAANFTGQIRYRQSGSNGNGNPNPPGVPGTIVSQSIAGGTFETPTKQGGTFRCNNDILVEYQ